jgi:hypothetical protein
MLWAVNAEQKILALESLLEKVRTNAAKPRPARGATIASSQPTTVASRATDDVAGPAVAAAPVRAPQVVAPGTTKFGDDDWSDTTETFDTPVPLAAPLPGLAKDAAKAPAVQSTAAKAPATATPKPADVAAAKPATPVIQAKPVIAPPTIKPALTTPAIKPAIATPAAKPATSPNTPIPLTNKVSPPVIKTPVITAPAVVKPAETNINKTLTGVGDGAVKAPDIRAGALAAGISLPITGDPPPVEPILDLEKKAAPDKLEADRKPSLPSAFGDVEGEEENEPTQLYEASAASHRAAELAAMTEKQLEDARKSLGIDKKSESDKVEIRLPDAKDKVEVKVDAPKLDLPWTENSERKIDPEKLGLAKAEDKPGKKGPSRTELDLELVASQEGALENVEVDVGEQKAAEKAQTKPATPAVSEVKPTPEPAPISDKKPIVEKKPVLETKPVVEKKPLVAEPDLEKPSQPSKGVPKLLIAVAVILVLAAGAFVAMKQGLLGGTQPATNPTVAPPTNPTPTAKPTAAPTATQTATADTATPPASAAPADSAAPAASSSAAPADSAAAAPADSAAAPPAPSASAAAEPATPPATAGTPSIDPATLNNNQGLIFVTANKPARVYLTGKLAGDTNTELKTDCGLKFVRLADPAQDLAKPPIWLTPGEPKQIDCRKYTTFSVNVP